MMCHQVFANCLVLLFVFLHSNFLEATQSPEREIGEKVFIEVLIFQEKCAVTKNLISYFIANDVENFEKNLKKNCYFFYIGNYNPPAFLSAYSGTLAHILLRVSGTLLTPAKKKMLLTLVKSNPKFLEVPDQYNVLLPAYLVVHDEDFDGGREDGESLSFPSSPH